MKLNWFTRNFAVNISVSATICSWYKCMFLRINLKQLSESKHKKKFSTLLPYSVTDYVFLALGFTRLLSCCNLVLRFLSEKECISVQHHKFEFIEKPYRKNRK